MCYDEDPSGNYSSCYNYGENCEDPGWYDCYWYENCDGSTGDDGGSFEDWIYCWENTDSMCYDEDPYGYYSNCYNYGEDCKDPEWYDCYWNNCESSGSDKDKEGYENFEDWLECYTATYEECGASHSEHYDCYWDNDGCQDPWWHDCYWYGEGCDDKPDISDEDQDYINGYFEGYTDGYTDGVIDTAGPEPEEKDAFHLELIVQSFSSWVEEQTQRSGRFHCGHDIRIDFPFDDTEHMALWAAQDCSDWDLYLTLVVPKKVGEMALTYTGAEPSYRRGCYETVWFDDVDACEFHMPHGGPNFGVLFQGGFHAIWYEYEWEYAPAWDSWFGGW